MMSQLESAEVQQELAEDAEKAEMAQVLFEVAGFPMQDAPEWADVVEERRVESSRRYSDGRFVVARQAIKAFTFVRVPKVRLVLSEVALERLHDAFSAFNRQNVPELLGYPSAFGVLVQEQEIPHGSEMLCFVGSFVCSGLVEDGVVREVMAYDAYAWSYLFETLSRLRLGDVLWLHFWREKIDASADTVWRAYSFLLSHAFKNSRRMLTLSPLCGAKCPQKRWDWYLAGSPESERPRLEDATVETLMGNFEEVSPWGRQTTVGAGQVSCGHECVCV